MVLMMENTQTHYPRQKICGIWLIIVGISMFTLLNGGYKQPVLFGILYALGMLFQLNPITRRKLAVGPGTDSQKKWSNISLIVLVVLCSVSGIISDGNIQKIWLFILLAVGIHFFFFIPVHGKLMGLLGIASTINALLALSINEYPLNAFFAVDGVIKLIFGILLVSLSPIDF
ncbi:DUF6609 family protein [Lactococcus lactis]|jgi:hypothetical protein|uniref:DUF6609 family protein n=1 Tax=Lactococcus lactis TaxID=1358 RepID=UPI002045A078|nr:DUF6609 family protein [Lactococcus lactis]WKF72853.1 hypothetical protein QYM42_10810 [Lactococcus lactis]BDH82370.1 hypothetical protein LLL8_20270 [Lactococcus lactis]